MRVLRRGGGTPSTSGGRSRTWPALSASARWPPPTAGGPDLIVDVGNGLPFLSPLCARRPVIVLVHHVHREQWPVVSVGLARFGWWMESWLAPRVYRRCRYVTVSAATRDELATLGVDRRTGSTVVHNGTPDMPSAPVPRATRAVAGGAGSAGATQAGRGGAGAVAALADELPGLT